MLWHAERQRRGPLTRYAKLRVAHAPGMPGTFFSPPTSKKPLFSDPGMHHGTCVTHLSWWMSGSLTRGGGENVPGIPRACAIHNFTYLVRGPWGRLWGVDVGTNRRTGNKADSIYNIYSTPLCLLPFVVYGIVARYLRYARPTLSGIDVYCQVYAKIVN